LRTTCQDWLWIIILLISASWVARITGVSYQHPAQFLFLWLFVLWCGDWTQGLQMLDKCSSIWASPWLFCLYLVSGTGSC
jgi:hypothetical protein